MPVSLISTNPLINGTYGYEIEFQTEVAFREAPAPMPQIVIKKPTNSSIIQDMDSFDFETGIGIYTIKNGDLNEPGTYLFSVVQKGENNEFIISSQSYKTVISESLVNELV